MTDLCKQIYSDAYIVVKGTIDRLPGDENKIINLRKMLLLKLMFHLYHAFQKLTVHNRQCRRSWYSHANV